jgi:hypothetical protein
MADATQYHQENLTAEESDLVWGNRGIARVIGKSPKATQQMLYRKQLPASKRNGQWVASKSRLKSLGDPEA